jgi:hypothetical protein
MVALTFIALNRALGIGNTFFLYFVVAVLSLGFACFVAPETKGARQVPHDECAQGRRIVRLVGRRVVTCVGCHVALAS